jgi:hypothetical protein
MNPDGGALPLTLVVPVLNEEHQLPRCLQSVAPCAEIIVVDSGSTDGTKRVADEAGARWLEHPWSGFAPQRNHAATHATQPWLLFLDADESLSPELRADITRHLGRALPDAPPAGFLRRSTFLGREIRHGDWANDRVVRLVRRGAGEWGGLEPHPVLRTDQSAVWLAGELKHQPYASIEVFQQKIESYAFTWAKGALSTGARGGRVTGALRAVWRLLRGYVLRGGFLDGFPGWVIALQNARMVFLKYECLQRLRAAARD